MGNCSEGLNITFLLVDGNSEVDSFNCNMSISGLQSSDNYSIMTRYRDSSCLLYFFSKDNVIVSNNITKPMSTSPVLLEKSSATNFPLLLILSSSLASVVVVVAIVIIIATVLVYIVKRKKANCSNHTNRNNPIYEEIQAIASIRCGLTSPKDEDYNVIECSAYSIDAYELKACPAYGTKHSN